jgi:hypothetical protein
MADERPGYSINADSGNIVIEHTGELTVRMAEGSRREAAKLATATQLSGILVDVSQAIPSLGTVDIFELCVSHGSVMPSHAVLAIVLRPDQFSAEDIHFTEAVSLNRGIALRTFTDRGAAQQWLSARRGP